MRFPLPFGANVHVYLPGDARGQQARQLQQALAATGGAPPVGGPGRTDGSAPRQHTTFAGFTIGPGLRDLRMQATAEATAANLQTVQANTLARTQAQLQAQTTALQQTQQQLQQVHAQLQTQAQTLVTAQTLAQQRADALADTQLRIQRLRISLAQAQQHPATQTRATQTEPQPDPHASIERRDAQTQTPTPPSDDETRLRAFVDTENLKACTKDKNPGGLDPSTIDLSGLSKDELTVLEWCIRGEALMQVTHGSKPIHAFDDPESLEFNALLKLLEVYRLRDRYTIVQSEATGFDYLVNKDNLLATIRCHQPTLENWFAENLHKGTLSTNPGIAKTSAQAKEELESKAGSPESMMDFVLRALETRTGMSSRLEGLLLGYGARNSENFELRESAAHRTRLEAESAASDTAKAYTEIVTAHGNSDVHSNFPAPPTFRMWQDKAGSDEPETAALATRYLNECLDMSQTVLKKAYESPESFAEHAPRVFLAALFEERGEGDAGGR